MYNHSVVYLFEYNQEKDQALRRDRGIGFQDIIDAINQGHLLDNINHPNPKCANQQVLVVYLNHYIYACPYVIKDHTIYFLKTIYPSRKLLKKYQRILSI